MDINKDELHAKVRDGFLTKWDPIGIGTIPEAFDEYDSYIPGMCQLLERGAAREEVFDFLWFLETETIGLNGNRQTTEIFANWLCQLV